MKKSLALFSILIIVCVLAATLSACTKYDYFERPEEHSYTAGHEFDEGFGNTNNGYAKDGEEVERLISAQLFGVGILQFRPLRYEHVYG